MSAKPAIGVVGLGAMGLGIVQVFAQVGHEVIATDTYQPARSSAAKRLGELLYARVAAGKLEASVMEETLARVKIVDDLAGLAPAGIAIEAIIEKLEAKQALFAALEDVVSANCVLTTNTSSLSVGAIMQGLKHPQRGLGLHFFNPAPVMKLVELITTPQVDAAAVRVARQATEGAGKTVVACANRPGFVVNRCARPFYGEALALLEEGRSASDIDAAMLAAGYKLGPFGLIDLVGADINLAATESLHAAMDRHPRYHVFAALKRQVAGGNLGRKTGRGFLHPDKPGAPPDDAAEIVLRIEVALANEAASLLSEGGVSADDINTAVKLGLNFPRGPFEAARVHGLGKVRKTLSALEATAPPHLKGRYVIVPALERMT